jgi:hypothetical protein
MDLDGRHSVKILAPHRHTKHGLRKQRGYISPAVLSAIAGRRRSGGTGGGGVVGPTDPHFASVVALLHFDGDDASTTFTDVKGHTFSGNGNAQIDTAQSKFGGSSLLLDGTGDFLASNDHSDWELGSGDFTVEMWVRFPALPAASGTYTFVSKFSGTTFSWRFIIFNSAGTIFLIWNGDDNNTSPHAVEVSRAWAATTNTWYHIASCRTGGRTYIFADGVELGNEADSITYLDNANPLRIGTSNGAGNFMNGWIDDLRITKGVARYVGSPSGFTIPNEAFPDQ